MHPHRALAVTATALLLGAIALSGCTPASSVPGVAVGPAVNGKDHPKVAVIGDSIESGAGLRPAEAWPALVAVDRRWELENYSVPGAGFVTHGDDEQDFGAQVDQAIALRADMVLIGASDNDLGWDVYTVSAAMTAAVERLRTALPHARILGFNALMGEASDDDLAGLNEALHDAVTAVGGRWLDLGQPYRGRAGLVQNDGEHPTPAGQQAIAAAVLKRLDDRG
ncbi:MAG: SGNH/GDSL hydrolase family protein [Mycobacterium sp.]|uniref:SGNH/GDSL hydrolase family protein n=1 Tax=Mycobacterium sp. TaxID=1785 RepID=UPI003F9C4E16